MACTNNALFYYWVRIENTPFHYYPMPGIVRISGLEHGNRGKETVTEYNRTINVVDNVRSLPTLSFDIRMQEKPDILVAVDNLKRIWKDHNTNRTIWVDIVGKIPVGQWIFKKSMMSVFKENQKELGKGFAYITVEFDPYDVEYKNATDLDINPSKRELFALGYANVNHLI